MSVIVWIVRLVVVILLVWFAAKNADLVSLNGFGATLRAPLALILLAFFGAGLLLGLVTALLAIAKLKREIRTLNRALQNRTESAAPSVVLKEQSADGQG
jgi:lipopolysaccharide assembly protein A